MHAEIFTKDQYPKWDAFAYDHAYTSIHQTSRWAHFQSNVAARDKFWIIGVFNDKETASKQKKNSRDLIAGTVLIRHKMPRGYTWLYAPRGPLLDYDDPMKAREQMDALLAKIKEIAKGEKTIFLRIDPLIEIQDSAKIPQVANKKKTLHFPKFHFSHLGYQPEDTLILDLRKSESDILAQMKEKGRYNIRLSAKKGVKIEEVKAGSKESQTQIQAYFDILQETLERDKFHGHGISFYKNMVDKLAPNDSASNDHASKTKKSAIKEGFSRMLIAYYDDPETKKRIPISGMIATFYKDTGTYYFGASSNTHRNVMAPYLLQWHAIQLAKAMNCTKYDFLGIAPESQFSPLGPKNHPWRGVTEFKRKFGGQYVKYTTPQDYVFKPIPYIAYVFTKHLRKITR